MSQPPSDSNTPQPPSSASSDAAAKAQPAVENPEGDPGAERLSEASERPSQAAEVAHKISKRRRFLRIGMQLLIALGVFFAVSQWQTRRLLPRGNKLAPNFTLPDLQGRPVRLSDYQGKSVLLHFWATWCGVCRQEVGALNALYDSLGEDQVLLTVAADGDDFVSVSNFVRERGVRYPVLLGNDAIVDAYRITMFPTNYFLDKDGRIAASTVGMSTRWALRTRMGCAR